jgi:CheY-like chemotaxis protein
MTRLLQASNFDVTPVADGAQALHALQAASAAGEPFHIAVLDMLMPAMTGPQAAAAFREWEQQ